jgi:hypothetical protein
MGWGAEQSAFAVTGALLLFCTAIASNPRWGIGRTWLVITVVGSFGAIGAAFLVSADDGLSRAPWAWLSALGPALLLLVWSVRIFAMWQPGHRALDCVVPGRGAHRRDDATTAAAQAAASARVTRAADPETPAAELADLAYSHPEARVAVATNPSTPANVLGWLAATGADDVMSAIAHRTGEVPPGAHRAAPPPQ